MFIVFEGGAGGGKSTQINLLVEALEGKGYKVKRVSVLDDTFLGREVKRITKEVPHGEFGHKVEALLFLAAIAHAVESLVRPALKEKFVVVADRYISSTIAYQGYGGQVGVGWLTRVADAAVGKLIPDLMVYLDIPVEDGLERHIARGESHFVQLAFRERVRQGYLAMAKGDENWLVIDARQSEVDIHQAILEKVLSELR